MESNGKQNANKKKRKKDTNKKSTSKRIKPSVTIEEDIDEDKCKHDHRNLGMSFNPDINGEYWKKGASMYGIICKGCNGSFYGRNRKCKVSVRTPAMTCKGREKYGCAYCLCHVCYTTELIGTDNSNKRTKRYG